MQPLQECSETSLKKKSVARVSKQAPLQGGAGGGGAAPEAFNGRMNRKVEGSTVYSVQCTCGVSVLFPCNLQETAPNLEEIHMSRFLFCLVFFKL